MRLRFVATLAVLAVAASAAAAAQAQPGDRTVDRGVVQTVEPGRLLLRALDGTDLALAVDPLTRVVLNGMRTRLAAIRPGFAAEVVHDGSGRASRLRAFGTFPTTERGVVVSLAQGDLVLERSAGGQVTLPLDQATRVRRGAVPVARRLLRPGLLVTVRLAANGIARVVVLRRG